MKVVPDDLDSFRAISLAPPRISNDPNCSCDRSASSRETPPRSSISHGIEAFMLMVALNLDQLNSCSNKGKRPYLIVTMPFCIQTSGMAPLNCAQKRAFRPGSPLSRRLPAPEEKISRPLSKVPSGAENSWLAPRSSAIDLLSPGTVLLFVSFIVYPNLS